MPAGSRKDPLVWEHVEVCSQPAEGDPWVQCSHCDKPPFRAGATKIRGHFLGNSREITACPNTPDYLREQLQGQVAGKQAKKLRQDIVRDLNRSNSDPTLSSFAASSRPSVSQSRLSSAHPSSAASTGRVGQVSIQQAFSKASKAETDAAVARWLYASGVPFNAIRNQYFCDMRLSCSPLPFASLLSPHLRGHVRGVGALLASFTASAAIGSHLSGHLAWCSYSAICVCSRRSRMQGMKRSTRHGPQVRTRMRMILV